MADYNELMEQYRKKLQQGTSATDYSVLYQTAAEALANAQQASYESRVADLQAQLPEIKTQYDAARTDAYRMSRKNARADNEALAALGLAGKLDGEARSGVSESSRIAEDIALRGNINRLNDSQLEAEQEIGRQIGAEGVENDRAISGIMSDYMDKMAAYRERLRDYEQQLKEFELKQQQFEENKRQSAVQNALKELDVFGRIMTKEASAALGLPIGTLSFEAQQKLAKSSGGGRRSSSSGANLKGKEADALANVQKYLSMPTDTYYAAYNSTLYGVKASEVPKYQANAYLQGCVRSNQLTANQAAKVRAAAGL